VTDVRSLAPYRGLSTGTAAESNTATSMTHDKIVQTYSSFAMCTWEGQRCGVIFGENLCLASPSLSLTFLHARSGVCLCMM
jgi:hypothetical protein